MSDKPKELEAWEQPEYYDGCDDESDDDAECGLSPDGQCGLAGSEHCDFDCPYRDSEFFAGSKAWDKAHCTCPTPPANPRGQDPYNEPKPSRTCPVHGDD